VRIVSEAGGDPAEPLRAFISSYTASRYSPQLAQRVTIAAYELLVNGLSYCSVAKEVAFELREGADNVEVMVSNHAVSARIEMLRAQLARLEVDAAGTYEDAMRRSLIGGVQRSMLGLARVVHEARMTLHVDEEQQRVGVVVMRAVCQR
jgi:hypothetical protein